MINCLYIYLINDKNHMWRQRLAPYFVAGCLCKPRHCATPSGRPSSPGVFVSVWMFALLEHAPLYVVLSFVFSFLCVLGQYRLRAWGSKENERVTGILRRYTSSPGPRLTHTSTVSNFEKFYLIYLFLTNTILNLYKYLSVAAPGFCLGGT